MDKNTKTGNGNSEQQNIDDETKLKALQCLIQKGIESGGSRIQL